MVATSTRSPHVAVEYDSRGQRVSKTFKCSYEARRFYVAKDKAGRHPRVRRIEDARTHQA